MVVAYEIEDIPYVDRRYREERKTNNPYKRIEQLEEEVAYYKSELGLQIEATNVHVLCKHLRIRPGVAYFLLALYNANCRVVTWEQLLDLIPGQNYENEDENNRGPRLMNTYASTVRRVLGDRVIEPSWGVGYCITNAGKLMVTSILNPAKEMMFRHDR